MFFKKKQEQSAEPAVVSAESSAERKLPLILPLANQYHIFVRHASIRHGCGHWISSCTADF